MARHLHSKTKRISPALFLAALAMAMAVPACSQETSPADEESAPAGLPSLGLLGSVPIYWGEAADFSGLIDGSAHTHWARALLEEQFALSPIDFLSPEALAGFDFLFLAQPRALAASENVDLDNWVREGGRLLLFADPMMTGESRFSLGDRRRPQDVTLLSPVLSHWGLDMQFDENQPAGLRMADAGDQDIPVNLAGKLVGREAGSCTVAANEVIARCVLGQGDVLVVADAAILDLAGPYPNAQAGLNALLAQIFGPVGENAGSGGDGPVSKANNGGNRPVSDPDGGLMHRSNSP